MPSPDPLELRRVVDKRGITRVCHFTHLSSFRQIAADGAIWSTQVLKGKHSAAKVNDRQRLDGHRDYISCSVQVPNAWLLDAYRENGHHTDEWIVLLLTPELLQQPSTRFSPVNAATAFGAHVTDGPDGLEAMFQQRPPSVNPIWRCQKHARSCPTDNQAEALVHQAIFTDEIIGIVCMTPESQQHVDRLLDSWDDPKPVTSVRDLLFDPHVLKHRIWNGDDIDLPVRGEND